MKCIKHKRLYLNIFPNSETRVDNTISIRSRVFWTNFKVFGNVVKHCLECLIYVLNKKKLESRRKKGNKIVKNYQTLILKDQTIQTPSRSRLPVLKLDELLMSLRTFFHRELSQTWIFDISRSELGFRAQHSQFDLKASLKAAFFKKIIDWILKSKTDFAFLY